MVTKMISPSFWTEQNAAAFLLRVSEPSDALLYLAVSEFGLTTLARMVWENELPDHYRVLGEINRIEQQRFLESDEQLLASPYYHLITPQSQWWPQWKFHRFEVSWDRAMIVGRQDLQRSIIAPIALWIKGNEDTLSLLEKPAISIVGTRSPSRYGERITEYFAQDIVQNDIVIVSGGAFGIDAISHWTALRNQGATISVLAGGIDEPSPRSHRTLFSQIAEHGLIVSEYPPGYTPLKHRFLRRNRLIAALSNCTLVTEAPLRSGALNTAWWAQQLGIPLASVPGPVSEKSNMGSLYLLRENKATLCITPQHCVELLPGYSSLTSDELSLFPR